MLWHGFTTTFVLSLLTLAGSVGLFALRTRLWRLRWPAALHTERLYSFTVSAPRDARGAASLPRCRARRCVRTCSPSLRPRLRWSHLRLPPTVPFRRRGAGHQSRFTKACWPRSSARERSRQRSPDSQMAAVLSLGTVGYGVAVLYALLGAPDLAMTQFAVETLTVVIFVLVFYRLRGFGDLSSRLIKTRDAIVAAAAGVLVTTLVLFVGASGTTSRLADYFADAAPRLAHGLNIVNVILVDFRGFDTLGEITVLVTVAIGVRSPAADRERASPMTSTILQTATRVLMPLLLLFAVFLLLRGHNQPGGGFVGGLVVASSFVLYSIAFGVDAGRRALLVRPGHAARRGASRRVDERSSGRHHRTAVHDRAVDGGARGADCCCSRYTARVRRRRVPRRDRRGADDCVHVGGSEPQRGLIWNCCSQFSRVCSMRPGCISCCDDDSPS